MVPSWKEREVERYLQRLQAALETSRSSHSKWARLFEDFLSATDLPAPDPQVAPYFHNPNILRELCEMLHVPHAEGIEQLLERVAPYDRDQRATFLRVRRLSNQGEYPNLELCSRRAQYIIRRATPYLVTLNSAREEAKFGPGSELTDWTRQETRIAAALACTEYGRFTIYLTEHGRDLPLSAMAHIEPRQRVDFATSYAALIAHGSRFDGQYYSRPDPVSAPTQFSDFRPFVQLARRFAARFLVSHPLLLRTASHFLRASMLWRSEGHTEDAMARLFFALEGCLLLMQETHGGRTDRLDRKHLRAVFEQTYVYGESLYDFIEEATGWGGTRARIVHPQLAVTEGWTPLLMADDYYEYARIVRALLMYVVTGESFPEYELVPA